ncbi:Trypsin Inhibitor like cysteine rich domain protein [Aphelenchoides besseyi]|nr:Trypsin Inhibitor like cysteine rich domain protein [Aphelenchoides besseyi]
MFRLRFNHKLTFILLTILHYAKSDRSQSDCQPNETFITCGRCEGTCKTPVIEKCPSECRPARCECESKNGFVRAHDGACIMFTECETYTLMSQIRPGQPYTSPPVYQHQPVKPTTQPVKKTTEPTWVKHFDEEPPSTTSTNDSAEEHEKPTTTFTTTQSTNEQNGLPPSIAPSDYAHLMSNTNVETEFPVTNSQNDQVAAPTQPTMSDDDSGYRHPPSSTYGAKPLLPGVVSADNYYIPQRPQSLHSAGAPSPKPTAPGTPYQYAYAPSIPMLMSDNNYILYPPQKYRIYRHRRGVQMPIGPS